MCLIIPGILLSLLGGGHALLGPIDSHFFYVFEILLAAVHTVLNQVIHQINRELQYIHHKKDGSVIHPEGFESPKFAKRSQKIEWEHIVPAENFGRGFPEWREGHADCVDAKGKPFKGRKCAEKVNEDFQYMVSDMYNLVPAIGSVNAMRSNFNFTEMHPSVENTFGSCPVKIVDRTVEPAEYSKGSIARTYFYIESKYPTMK